MYFELGMDFFKVSSNEPKPEAQQESEFNNS